MNASNPQPFTIKPDYERLVEEFDHKDKAWKLEWDRYRTGERNDPGNAPVLPNYLGVYRVSKENPELFKLAEFAGCSPTHCEDQIRAYARRAQEKIDAIESIQRKTSLDPTRAGWLNNYRHGEGLPEHQEIFCQKYEERTAIAAADRALGNLHNGGNGYDPGYAIPEAPQPIDWDALDRRHHQGGSQGGVKGERKLGEWDAGDDPGPISPREWLLGNQFCRTFISSIVAAGGTGKSATRLLQFISLATGRSLCGQHVFRRSRVLIVSLEDDNPELQRRIKAVLDHYDIPRSELKGWLFCVGAPKLAKLAEMKNRTRTIGLLEQQIRDAIERLQPDVISLDPFVKTHSLEENNSGDMDFVCDLLARLAVDFNVAVEFPHHVHKGQVSPGDANSGRGSSGIRDAARLVYTLAPMSEAEAKLLSIDPGNRHSYIRLDPAKINIAAHASKAEWFKLVGVPIGNGTPEYPNGDTIQVVEPWSPPDTWGDTTSEGLNAILDEIDRGMDNGQRYSNMPAATDRQVWPVVQKVYPDKPEGSCRTIIHAWLNSGLLYQKDYNDPKQYRPRKGLFVDSTKRPGTETVA